MKPSLQAVSTRHSLDRLNTSNDLPGKKKRFLQYMSVVYQCSIQYGYSHHTYMNYSFNPQSQPLRENRLSFDPVSIAVRGLLSHFGAGTAGGDYPGRGVYII